MIRPAIFQDVPAITAMLRDMHAASKYAGRVEISAKAMESVILALVAGQKQPGPQGSFCRIAEEKGEAVGFMAGVLDRVYHIGTKLIANDAYLYVRPGSRAAHGLALIDAYVAWASGNSNVIEIKLSWVDIAPGSERIGDVYSRKGFIKTGEIYELRLDAPAREEAA